MASLEEFRLAILESPQDDALRLVFADYLEEHANPRCEWLRAEVQGESFAVSNRFIQCEKRLELAELSQDIETEWLATFDRAPIAYCLEENDECPGRWELFTPTEKARHRRCSQCDRDVTYCRDWKQATQYVRDGYVAIGFAGNDAEHAFSDFTLMAFSALEAQSPYLSEDDFWPIIERIDWANNHHRPFTELSAELAQEVSLLEAIDLYQMAVNLRWEVEEIVPREIIDHISSEDGMDDFGYHLVGLGREFFEAFRMNPETALSIALEDNYVESLRYVFTGVRDYYPIEEWIAAFRVRNRFAERGEPTVRWQTMVMASPTLPGLAKTTGEGPTLPVFTVVGEIETPWSDQAK